MTEELIETEMADYPYSTDGEPMPQGAVIVVGALVVASIVFAVAMGWRARNGR